MLVAAMHQRDFSLCSRMNLQSDAVIANQADTHSFDERRPDGTHSVKLITTPFRGLGLNRSTALLYATGDVCVLSDEDVVLADGYRVMVLDAFAALPRADIIAFNLELAVGDSSRSQRLVRTVRRVRAFQALRYASAPRLAFRRRSVLRANVWFSPLFGAGSPYSMGEETLFVADCLRKGLKVYVHPGILGSTSVEQSTWFDGYTDDYFHDKGALFYSLSRFASMPLSVQDVVRHRSVHGSDMGIGRKLRTMREGARELRDYGRE